MSDAGSVLIDSSDVRAPGWRSATRGPSRHIVPISLVYANAFGLDIYLDNREPASSHANRTLRSTAPIDKNGLWPPGEPGLYNPSLG